MSYQRFKKGAFLEKSPVFIKQFLHTFLNKKIQKLAFPLLDHLY